MRVVGIILGVLVVVVCVVLGIATQQPEAYRVQRSVATSAAAADVFAIFSDLHRFSEWSPWDKLDPNLKRTYDGPPMGTGASFAWEGNDEVGAGKMTITAVTPGQSVAIDLVFLRPFPSEAKIVWQVEAEGPGSKLTWTMDGKKDQLLVKVFHLFMDFDKMIGADFEKGLAQLKALSEKASHSNGATVP